MIALAGYELREEFNGIRTAGFLEEDLRAGVLKNVKLCGLESRNIAGSLAPVTRMEFGEAYDKPYGYAIEALKGAAQSYVGLPIYMDHPSITGGVSSERSVNNTFGEITKAWVIEHGSPEDVGLWGNAEFLTKHAYSEPFIEMVQRFPRRIGFSHIAGGVIEKIDGRGLVTEIKQPQSCDLVADPATVGGLQESTRRRIFDMAKSFTTKRGVKLVDAIARMNDDVQNVTLLREMLDETAIGQTEMDQGMTDEDMVFEGLIMAVTARLRSDPNLLPEVLKTVGIDVMKTGDQQGQQQGDQQQQQQGQQQQQQQQPQQQQQQPMQPVQEGSNEWLRAENMLLKEGREATQTQVIAVASVPEEHRKTLIESFVPENGQQQQSTQQTQQTQVTEGTQQQKQQTQQGTQQTNGDVQLQERQQQQQGPRPGTSPPDGGTKLGVFREEAPAPIASLHESANKRLEQARADIAARKNKTARRA